MTFRLFEHHLISLHSKC